MVAATVMTTRMAAPSVLETASARVLTLGAFLIFRAVRHMTGPSQEA